MNDERVRNTITMASGLLLVMLGALFLLGQWFAIDFWRLGWPAFIIIPGLVFFTAMLAFGRSLAPLALPGSIITGVGLILAVQNATGYWQSWAYAWTLIIVAVAVGLAIMGLYGRHGAALRAARGVMIVGLVQFVIWGAFFELVIGLGGHGLPRLAWPLLLIMVGVVLLARHLRVGGAAAPDDGPRPAAPAAPDDPWSGR